MGLSGNGLFGNESEFTVRDFRDQTGVTFPLLLNDSTYFRYANPDGAISPYPLDVIIDKQGRIAYLRHAYELDAMTATIDRLLDE